MEEKKLKEKIENNAKKLRMNQKNKSLLLKGRELDASLKYLSEENIKFMLTREIELIQASIQNQRKRKYINDFLFVVAILVLASFLFFKEKSAIIAKINNFNDSNKIFKENSDCDSSLNRVEKKIKIIKKEENKTVKVALDQNSTFSAFKEDNSSLISTENISNLSKIMDDENQ